jgi:hypothetical protein
MVVRPSQPHILNAFPKTGFGVVLGPPQMRMGEPIGPPMIPFSMAVAQRLPSGSVRTARAV